MQERTGRDLALYVALRDGRLLKPESMDFLLDWFPAGEGVQVGHNVFRNGTMHSGRVPASAGSVARTRAFIEQALRVAGAG